MRFGWNDIWLGDIHQTCYLLKVRLVKAALSQPLQCLRKMYSEYLICRKSTSLIHYGQRARKSCNHSITPVLLEMLCPKDRIPLNNTEFLSKDNFCGPIIISGFQGCRVADKCIHNIQKSTEIMAVLKFLQDLRITRHWRLGCTQTEMVAADGTLWPEQPHQCTDRWQGTEASQFCRRLLHFSSRPSSCVFGGSAGVVVEQQPLSSRNSKRGP